MHSANNLLSNNAFVNNGLTVRRSYFNAVENNTVNGKPLVYLENKSNFRIQADAGQVVLVRCDNIKVDELINECKDSKGLPNLEALASISCGECQISFHSPRSASKTFSMVSRASFCIERRGRS